VCWLCHCPHCHCSHCLPTRLPCTGGGAMVGCWFRHCPALPLSPLPSNPSAMYGWREGGWVLVLRFWVLGLSLPALSLTPLPSNPPAMCGWREGGWCWFFGSVVLGVGSITVPTLPAVTPQPLAPPAHFPAPFQSPHTPPPLITPNSHPILPAHATDSSACVRFRGRVVGCRAHRCLVTCPTPHSETCPCYTLIDDMTHE
jgi:hypothetical protein